VTIPKHVRDHLGLKPRDNVEFVVIGDEARLRKSGVSIRDVAGSLQPLPVPLEDMPAIAREARDVRESVSSR